MDFAPEGGNPHLTRRWSFWRVTEGLPTNHPECPILLGSWLNERLGPVIAIEIRSDKCRDGKLVNERLLTSETNFAPDRRCSFDLYQALN